MRPNSASDRLSIDDDLESFLKGQTTSPWIGYAVIGASFAPIMGLLIWGFIFNDRSLIIPLVTATLLSVFTPVVIISIRHFVRLARLRLIDLFDKSFKQIEWNENASFEGIKAKYLTDLPGVKSNDIDLNLLPSRPFSLPADWMLLLCSLPFIVFSWLCFFLLFAPIIVLEKCKLVNPSLLLAAGNENARSMLATVALSAFAGAYFYSINIFIRSIASFDMTPITLIKAFVQLVFASILAIVLWRAMSQFGAVLPDVILNVMPKNSKFDSSEFWVLFSFALGFLPNGAIQLILKKSGLQYKRENKHAESLSLSIPCTVIDGIDYFMAYRLQEANIYDVQNLAVYNPLMLYIETPFTFYQTIDWAAQAQLCIVVGAERFLLFRLINIRTIFDLERAVLGIHSPEGLKWRVGSILFCETYSQINVKRSLDFKELEMQVAENQDLRPAYARSLPAWIDISVIEYAARVMIDDLHVHRLRQIWSSISTALGKQNEHLVYVKGDFEEDLVARTA